jgi:hypothetical protein
MRWLVLLAVSFVLSHAGVAGAVPQPDAEAAYQRGDYAAAYRLWLPLAQQGSSLAQLNIGRMYERGEGMPQNQQAAMDWYRKAAEQNARDDGSVAAAKDLDDALARVPLPASAPGTNAATVAPPTAQQPTIVPVSQSVQRPVAYPPAYYQPVYRVQPFRPAPVHHHFRH